MSEYKFGIGEHKTVGECRAVVTCDDAPGMWPLMGYVVSESGCSHPHGWTRDGRTYETRKSEYDLMPPAPAKPEPVVRWVNLYQRKDGSLAFGGGAHATLSDAQDASRLGLGAFLRTIRISSDNEDRYAAGWDAALDAVAVKLSEIGTLSGVNTAFSLKGKANA